MRAAFYSPYLNTMGGGERYLLTAARVLADQGWDVYVEADDPGILDKAGERLGIDLTGIASIRSIRRGDGYDLCFWLSDGSIPRMLSRKNLIHFQRPFYRVDGKSLINRMKLIRVEKVIVNSEFTKSWIDGEFPVDSVVLYPPVDTESFKPSRTKENIILYVGRFSQLEQSKGQDILVDAFKQFYDSSDTKWRLVLAGGSDVGRTKFVDDLKKNAEGYPVEILENVSFPKIKELFAKAKIFWSASGYGIDIKQSPEKVEHFGISIVEAMSAGAVPIAFKAGGHMEIINNMDNGILWEKKEELIAQTKDLVKDGVFLKSMAKRAIGDSKKYGHASFKAELMKIING